MPNASRDHGMARIATYGLDISFLRLVISLRLRNFLFSKTAWPSLNQPNPTQPNYSTHNLASAGRSLNVWDLYGMSLGAVATTCNRWLLLLLYNILGSCRNLPGPVAPRHASRLRRALERALRHGVTQPAGGKQDGFDDVTQSGSNLRATCYLCPLLLL